MICSFLKKNFKKFVSYIVLGTIGMSILPVQSVQAVTFDGNKEKIPRTVTKYEMVSAGGSTVGKYEVNGTMAFCAQHSVKSPAKGSPISNARLVTKDTIRKVLYYGYGGPNKLSDINGNAGWVITSLALSYANTDSGGPSAKAFVDRVSKMATPPSGFKVYVVDTNGGRTQELMYWKYAPKGELQIDKSSDDTSMTNGNNGYSLEGAVYGVYKNSNATNKVAELKTNASGISNTVSLDESNYYIKEIKAPKGYALDTKIYSIKVNSGKKAIGRYKDRPQSDPVGILLKKIDEETGESKPQGGASLENAEFTFKFYEGNYGENVNPEKLGKKPNRTWIMKTNKFGYTELNENFKVSGDKFYYNGTKNPTLPIGTVVIQETKAPKGYKINPEIFVRKITSNGTAENVNTYNVPVAKEEVIKGQVKLIKVDEETGKKLEGAKFEVKEKKTGKVLENLTTDKKGEAMTKWYPFGTELMFREIKAPDHYVLNGKEYFATINDKQQTIELTVTNKVMRGTISIHKVDKKTKQPLQGVEFDVLDINNKVIEHLVTDKEGNLRTKDLDLGVYNFVETKGLDGYISNNIPIVVNITENKDYSFIVENEKLIGSMELLKLDNDTKEPMKEVEFKVVGLDSFDKDKEFTLKTNEEGKAALNGLHKGKFRVDEIKTLEGYLLNKETVYFEITENGQVVKLEITNQIKKGSVSLVKVDEDTNRKLENAVFELHKVTGEEDKVLSEYTTNKNGKIFVKNLIYGDYYFKEIKAPNHYELSDKTYPFSVREDGEVIELTATNKVKKGDVEFSKTDVTTGETIDGAKIEITGVEEQNKHIKVDFTSSKDGNKFTLPEGKYEFKEIQAPNGYVISEEVGTFEIKDGEVVTKAELKNKRIEGTLDFTKVDATTGKPLEGAKIKIECLEGFDKGKVIEFTSSKDGNRFKLFAGKYKISETQAPNGYETTTETGTFEVKEDGQIIKCKLSNKMKIKELPATGYTQSIIFVSVGILAIILGAFLVIRRNKKVRANK